jgi:molybdenum cofactor cytidylyltransferase
MAAGSSQRMGTPKQLLQWGDKSLVQHQLDVLKKTQIPLTLVVGAHAENILRSFKIEKPTFIENQNWKDGLGSSIAFSTKVIRQNIPDLEGLLIVLVDQPLVEASHYLQMIEAFQPGEKQIIVSLSKTGYWSVPVLFDVYYLSELEKLKGDQGAMKIIREHETKVKLLPCETSLEDMDTSEAYKKLLQMKNHGF